jgi:hypothetical protein
MCYTFFGLNEPDLGLITLDVIFDVSLVKIPLFCIPGTGVKK